MRVTRPTGFLTTSLASVAIALPGQEPVPGGSSPPPGPPSSAQPQSTAQDPVPQAPQQPDAPAAVEARRRALERALAGAAGGGAPGAQAPSNQGAVPVPSGPAGALGAQGGAFRLLGISFDLMTAAGASSEPDPTIRLLQGGQHDPVQRGFTLQQAEVQMNGAVDPYFRGQFVLVTSLEAGTGETIVEVEEAWLITQQLPANLQLKAGHYLTQFGRINPVHPHAWDFIDQPVMLSRCFGPDGLRSPGAELSWLAPTRTYLELFAGLQNAAGETLQSFLANEEVYAERPIGGRLFPDEAAQVRSSADLLWHGRVATSFDPGDESTFGGGVSGLYGPNATGGDTWIAGVDAMWRWRPLDNRRGYPFVKVQAEFLARSFDAAAQVDASDPTSPVQLPAERLSDYGGYLYAVWGFDVGWALGMRAEWATGSGASYSGGGQFGRRADPFRADRMRLSPLLSYQTSEFSRVRLQYNYDDTDFLDRPAHSLWLGFEILIGPHQPHTY